MSTAGFLRVFDDTAEAELHLQLYTAEWVATLEWLRFHDVDPTLIPAGSVVEVDRPRRQIRYERCVLDENGHVRIDEGGLLLAAPVVQQGEALAPFPDELEAAFAFLLGPDHA